jgi:predicted ATP-dependent Lon-type protease
MELKEFVTESLMQIVEGIADAQKRLKENGSEAIINTNMTATDVGHVVTGGRRRPVEFVEFDVAVIANEGTEMKGGVGLTVASLLKFEAGAKGNQSTGSESRIKFKVPLSYPMHKWKADNAATAKGGPDA